MSREEQDDLIGKTLLRYQDQKKHLACLETKAHNMARELGNAAKILDPVSGQKPPHGCFRELPTPDGCDSVVSAIHETRSEIGRLRSELERMGVQFPIN